MVTGYVCNKCGNKHLVEEDKKEDTVKKTKTCHRCRRILSLQKKANRRGKPKNYYIEIQND